MKRSVLAKIIAVVMAVVILAVSIPLSVNAENTTIQLGLVSDIHYFADSIKGKNREAFERFTYLKSKEYTQINSLLDNALTGVETLLNKAENEDADFLLIPGDLTKDGEYESHIELAKKLENWQKKTGIPVFVTNGNHDINNSGVVDFSSGKKEVGRKTSPEEFKIIYRNLGWDKADVRFKPANYPEEKGGMLSYAANLGDNFRLIVVDTNIYMENYGGKEGDEHITDGRVSDELLDWVCNQARDAKKNGITPVVMQHHNIVPHNDIEEATFWAFVCWDWEQVADAYADAGIHYVFSGHYHMSDTSSYVNDNGERITDITLPSLTGFPNYFKTADLTTDGSNITLKLNTYDIDDAEIGLPKIKSDSGEVYDRPYKYTKSFDQTFGTTIDLYVERLLEGLIEEYFTQIKDAGGLVPFLKTRGVDIEELLVGLIKSNGISIGNIDILTVRTNAMGFVNDIDRQLMNVYFTKPEETLEKVMAIVRKLLSLRVSEYPCTYNSEKLGTPLTGKGCTLGEYATTVLLQFYEGDEHLYGNNRYKYVKDAIDAFDSGELTQEFFELLIDTILKDLLEGEILSNIDFNPGELFPEGTMFALFGKIIQCFTEKALGGDNSLLNLVNSVLSLSIVPDGYNSIEEILNTLVIDRYLTKSQYESWGYTIGWMVKSLIYDDNPKEKYDNNVTITYSGPERVEATKENFRLPANLVMNLTEDETTSMTLTWLTKYSVTETDIELIEYSKNPRFKGRATRDERVNATHSETIRSYPGADLGILAVFPLEKTYIEHTITLTGLIPGEKYSYRVGSAKRGWWSEPGVITMSAGKDEAFTFINIADPQAQRESHYQILNEVMGEATRLYPDARFTVCNGDQVDLGENSKHWNYFFHSTPTFRSLPFMPVAGNHEKKGHAIKRNFRLPNVPEQDEENGTFYSFDYNNVHFTILNTNDLTDDKISQQQIDWMKQDIKNSDAKWKVVAFHKALYCNGIYYKDDETVALRNQLSSLLPYLGVDLVLTGHNHVYSRTGAMNANCVLPTIIQEKEYNGQTYKMKINPKGTIYSIVSSAGAKEYKEIDPKLCDRYFSRPESIVNNDYPMFAAITVDGDSLYYNAYQVIDGEAKLVDSFGITKPEGVGILPGVIKIDTVDNFFNQYFQNIRLVG